MELRVEQGCPQCGAPVTLHESDRLLTCEYCGVKSFLQTSTTFRYHLPGRVEPPERRFLLYVPYIRFKSTIFTVSEKGIAYRVIDTTQLSNELPGLPPTLGMRPQAMKLSRLSPGSEGRFLPLSIKAKDILEKAALLSRLSGQIGKHLFHRAYIGDTLSFIYLPLRRAEGELVDAVTDSPLTGMDDLDPGRLRGSSFQSRWQVRFLPTLCPRCGWNLSGEADCLVLTCTNCHTAWEGGNEGLRQIDWQVVPGDRHTALYLAFWKVTAQMPAQEILTFADFINRTNQPLVAKPAWQDLEMSYWIPAFKVRPKIFLNIARQVTVGQWRLQPGEGRVVQELYPVTLPRSEARQALKITLAASATSPRHIFARLPETRVKNARSTLVFLPFADRSHDWVQPQTGAVVAKSILRFGRTL